MRLLGTLRAQVAAGMALLAIGVLAVMALLQYLGAERLLRAELDRHLHRDIEAAMHALAWDGTRHTWRETPHPEGDNFDTEPAVELWLPGTPPQRLYRREAQGPANAAVAGLPALQAPRAPGYRTLATAGGDWREAVELRQVAGDPRPVWVRTLRSEAPLRRELAALALRIGAGSLVAALLCAALAAAWVGRAMAPLGALAQRMQRINARPPAGPAGSLAEPRPQAAEVAALAQEFDALLQRLAQSHLGLERFAADCAHALRTPLTALRLRGEREGQALPDGPAREAVAGMLEEADRMSVLIQRLLLLARAADADPAAHAEPVELAALLAEVFDLMEPLAEQRGVRLQVLPAAGLSLTAQADAAWLRQVVQDLLHNALEHAAEPGHTLLGDVRREGDMAVIELRDNGPGMPAEVLSRLGLPAWPQPARSPIHRPRSAGTGLGLSIAARLLAVQGGRLELLPGPSGGTRVRCLLPAAPRP
jgi:signal transduction histidine kinase